MIGYNVKEINNLLEAVQDSYKQIKDAMDKPWDALSDLMRKEWVGEDELANENTLANALSDLYQSCSETVNGVINNVHAIGDAWRQFQAGNTIEGGVSAGIDNIGKLMEIKVQSDTLDLFKGKKSHIDENANLGLQNGLSSASAISTGIDDYAKAVYAAVEKLYQDLDANKAFLGEDQAPKITNYLHEMGKAIAKLTVCIKSVKEAIDKAAQAYKSQATSTSDQVSQLKTDIDTDQALV